MNTITRNNDGTLNLFETVKKTLLVIYKKGGMYRIQDVVDMINMQLPQQEELTRRIVKITIVNVLESAKEK